MSHPKLTGNVMEAVMRMSVLIAEEQIWVLFTYLFNEGCHTVIATSHSGLLSFTAVQRTHQVVGIMGVVVL